VRFLVDMPLSPSVADWLRGRGHDAVHATQVGLGRTPDAIILQRAQVQSRILLAADLDYPRLLALAKSAGPGLNLFRGGNFSEQGILDRLAKALAVIPDTKIVSSIIVIEQSRIRRRDLPIA
jgi:predicted nuclease of predicted toxin-antitoxin system